MLTCNEVPSLAFINWNYSNNNEDYFDTTDMFPAGDADNFYPTHSNGIAYHKFSAISHWEQGRTICPVSYF